jgi:hypothetical protein
MVQLRSASWPKGLSAKMTTQMAKLAAKYAHTYIRERPQILTIHYLYRTA